MAWTLRIGLTKTLQQWCVYRSCSLTSNFLMSRNLNDNYKFIQLKGLNLTFPLIIQVHSLLLITCVCPYLLYSWVCLSVRLKVGSYQKSTLGEQEIDLTKPKAFASVFVKMEKQPRWSRGNLPLWTKLELITRWLYKLSN